MAKINIERAYIEPHDENEDFQILVHIKDGNNHVYAGKVELVRNISWVHMQDKENGDLMVNTSENMDPNKWDHIIKEILDGE